MLRCFINGSFEKICDHASLCVVFKAQTISNHIFTIKQRKSAHEFTYYLIYSNTIYQIVTPLLLYMYCQVYDQ